MERSSDFTEKLSTLPSLPGVYLMKNAEGKIIYVGKSKCLKNRVSSYFHSSGLNIKTQKLVSKIFDFEIIVTRSENEALVLENELIKRHNPKYNIKLKDAKTYPYIKLTLHNGYPSIVLERRRSEKNADYFGPFPSSYAVNDIIKTICKSFKIPDCGKRFAFQKKICRPCLNFHMDFCLAPCTGNVQPSDYTEAIKDIKLFLKGDCQNAIASLESKMLDASNALRFEEAAKYRDTLSGLKKLNEKQAVVSMTKNEEDVFGFFESDTLSCITVLKVRGGIVSDKECIFMTSEEICDGEAMCDLILRYYENYDTIPRSIIVSLPLSADLRSSLSEVLSELSRHTVTVHCPERGEKKALCTIAVKNSEEAIRTKLAVLSKNEETLCNISALLKLELVPERIESYDISNSGTSSMYAGMIVLENGRFSKKDYRAFSIKSVEGQNDYAAMSEALRRRLLHVEKNDDESMNNLPDLILVDGGEGHVSTANAVLEELGMYVPVFGMIKDEHHKTRTLTDGKNEISIAHDKELFTFFYKIQEEVHRYTFGKMDASRRKSVKKSSLSEIDGIGNAKATALLKHFGSIKEIKSASKEELCQVSGISEALAENIMEYFKKSEEY